MARFSILALAALLLMSSTCVYGLAITAKEFTIAGKVLCQDCTKGWNNFVHGATPIPGAKVDIICRDKKGRPVYHYSDYTDKTGVYSVTIPYTYHGCPLEPTQCVVRLVSSPTECNVFSNFNHGKDGICPVSPKYWHPNKAEFEMETFYFTIPKCDNKK